MSKFKQRLLKRQKRFQMEIIPNMHAYSSERRNTWTREEVKDYQKFKKLLTLFAFCLANVVTATANEWR